MSLEIFINNFSYSDIAENTRNISNTCMDNAYRIAWTEGHRIQNQSAMDAESLAKDNGADVVKQWDATLDSKTRPHHTMLDGQIRKLDKPFEIACGKAVYPSGFGIASEDIHCRCALLQRATWALDKKELQTLKERSNHSVFSSSIICFKHPITSSQYIIWKYKIILTINRIVAMINNVI